MRHPSGPTLARLLVLLLFLASSVPPGLAGSQTAPEVDDGDAGDVTLLATVPGAPAGLADEVDILAGWITEDTANLYFHIEVAAEPNTATSPTAVLSKAYSFNFTIGGASRIASATVTSEGTAFGGVATAASTNGTIVQMLVPKSAVNGTGATLSAFSIETEASAGPFPVASDTATGGTATYTTASAGPAPNPNAKPGDQDGDGLNDTFEFQYFKNATSNQTGSGDQDGDGLNNTREQQLGTDPTKADTDGDGTSDKAEVDAGTDPKNPNSKPAPPTTSASPTPTASSSSTPTPTSSSPAPTTAATTAPEETCDAANDLGACFTGSNLGYAAAAGGIMVAILCVCLIALLGRWSV